MDTGRTCLCLMLAAAAVCRVASAENWADQREAGPFQLYANFALDGTLPLVAELEQLQRRHGRSVRRPSHAGACAALLVSGPAVVRAVHAALLPRCADARALFIKGSMPGWVFAYQNADYEVDLRHETTHALLHSDLPTVPLWLDEGIAEYYEVSAAVRVYDSPYLSAVKRDAWFFRVPSLRRLEELREMSRMEQADYQAAWSWIHFMLHGPPEARPVLLEYLADLRERRASDSLNDRLHAAIPDVEKKYLKHFRNWHR